MMMILFHVWPEQTYRFSTRKLLPSKKNKFSKKLSSVIPYDLLKFKSSNMSKMKEINVVGIGSSFDLNNLKKLHDPIFLVAFHSPLKIDNDGKIFYNHIFSYETGKYSSWEKIWRDEINKEYKKNNMTYVNGRKQSIELFQKNGNNILSVFTYVTVQDGNHYPVNKDWETSSWSNLLNHHQNKYIAIAEKFYQPAVLPSHLPWTATKSFLPALCALSFFAEKINVYGWDFYLESSPENMSYWQLFFNMYKYKQNDKRGKEHFETALINFYYGYQLSKLPNIKIHGYMGKLDKHYGLIRRIERVLFN
jgi:hypothetical protein